MFTFLFIVHNNKWQKRWPVENIDEYQDITRMLFSVQKTSALEQQLTKIFKMHRCIVFFRWRMFFYCTHKVKHFNAEYGLHSSNEMLHIKHCDWLPPLWSWDTFNQNNDYISFNMVKNWAKFPNELHGFISMH